MKTCSARLGMILLLVVLLAGCTFVVQDTRTPEEKAVAEQVKAEAAALEEAEAGQADCSIKVNVSDNDSVYHLPGGVYYDRVKVDLSQGDLWVCSEEEAVAAGARKSSR